MTSINANKIRSNTSTVQLIQYSHTSNVTKVANSC